MQIDLFKEIKQAIKEALNEWYQENRNSINGIHSKTEEGTNLLTVNQFVEKHTFITLGGLRCNLNFREYNGMAKCISKVGKKILIKEKEMLEWYSNPPKEAKWTYDKKRHGHD